MNKVQPAPWSYSKLKSFQQCPKQFYHLKVAKDYKEPLTQAIYYGNAFHKAAEHYVQDGTPLPKKFMYAKEALDSLIAKEGEKLCEYRMGLTSNLEPCSFSSKDVWWRGIADLIIMNKEKQSARVVDYKTGKSAQYADKGQLDLMALAMFKHFPELKKISGGLLFVVPQELITNNYVVEDQTELWGQWTADFMALEAAFDNDVWNPNPSGLCKKHCVVLDCPHNGRS